MLPLTPQVFAILSALIEERMGLHYGPSDLDLLRDKLSYRAQEAGFTSLLDYYYFLRYDEGSGAEYTALIDALVVGETYFFREFDQLKVLVGQLVASRLKQKARVRIWSAACATGEEPLTVAMLLAHSGLLPRVDLVASDISQTSLARARAGKYGQRSLRITPEPELVRKFIRSEGTDHTVVRELVDKIEWKQVNLTDTARVQELGTFDFILCRNVLIYFRDETAHKVLGNLSSVLLRDGVLLVSVSESLMRFGSAFVCEEVGGAFIYRKAA